MFTFLLGPILGLFPKRWRAALPWREAVRWHVATALSGSSEGLAAVVAMMYWYSDGAGL